MTRLLARRLVPVDPAPAAAWRIVLKPWPSCLAIALLAIGLRLALLPVYPAPYPLEHDEFSYILGGQTFAAGRVVNPPHPLWEFFETLHVNMLPTYGSKYPPGQSLFLALGIALFGHPWFGVVLSVGAMCGALTWMLRGWVAPKFALAGGALSVYWFAIGHYWMNSYWGGAVAAAGGALVFGALGRLLKRPGPAAAVAGAAGLAILANSRPYEGLLFTVACGAVLLYRAPNRKTFLRPAIWLPAAGLLLPTAAGMLYYNYRHSGNPLKMPYTVNQERYATSPIFWVSPPVVVPPKSYRDASMRQYWDGEERRYSLTRRDPIRVVRRAGVVYKNLFAGSKFGQTGAVPGSAVLEMLAGLSLLMAANRRFRTVLFIVPVLAAGALLNKNSFPHYVAPLAAVLLLMMTFGLRILSAATIRGRRVGPVLLGIVAAMACADALQTLDARIRVPAKPGLPLAAKFDVEEKLRKQPGRHVVFVRYSPEHVNAMELIYNSPNIDAQKVVWAFDHGPERNRKLLDYYRGRSFWLLQPDPPKPVFAQYTEPAR